MEKKRLQLADREIDVEVYAPAGNAPAPGILLLHELMGLLDFYRQDAADLAKRGFIVYVPDLFTGGAMRYCIRAMVSAAGRKNSVDNPLSQEVHAMLDALKADPRCNGRLGMLGQCLTGGFVLHMAQRDDMLAPVVYHHSLGIEGAGVPEEEMEQLGRIKVLQGHWGNFDPMCPASRRNKLIDALGDRVEAHTYNLPHGFRSTGRYLPAAKKVWSRTVDFFERELMQA